MPKNMVLTNIQTEIAARRILILGLFSPPPSTSSASAHALVLGVPNSDLVLPRLPSPKARPAPPPPWP
jgi:hypothetical protein